MSNVEIVWAPVAIEYANSLPEDVRTKMLGDLERAVDGAVTQRDKKLVEVPSSNHVLAVRLDLESSPPLVMVEVRDEARDDALKARPQRRGRQLTRDEAAAIVEAGIGRRPDLPAGSEYVAAARSSWKGLLPRGRRAS